jgi:hypothetical protein
MQQQWFASHVRSIVNAVMENNAEPDADGDFAFGGETCNGWIQPIMHQPWGVRISAVAAHSVPVRAAVLREINEVNCVDPMASTYIRPEGTVIVTHRLTAESVTEEHVRGILIHVITVADRIGPMLSAVHGGDTPKPIQPAITEG